MNLNTIISLPTKARPINAETTLAPKVAKLALANLMVSFCVYPWSQYTAIKFSIYLVVTLGDIEKIFFCSSALTPSVKP
jgi:hypothetical protein